MVSSSLWRRVLAAFCDVVIIGLLAVPGGLLMLQDTMANQPASSAHAALAGALIWVVLVPELLTGFTMGKRAYHLRVVGSTRFGPPAISLLVRFLVKYWVVIFAIVDAVRPHALLPGNVGDWVPAAWAAQFLVSTAVTAYAERRSLHDVLAGTSVVPTECLRGFEVVPGEGLTPGKGACAKRSSREEEVMNKKKGQGSKSGTNRLYDILLCVA
jgi:uncharacterized RDD family membrane protein YckC